jgi:hypothetical protein
LGGGEAGTLLGGSEAGMPLGGGEAGTPLGGGEVAAPLGGGEAATLPSGAVGGAPAGGDAPAGASPAGGDAPAGDGVAVKLRRGYVWRCGGVRQPPDASRVCYNRRHPVAPRRPSLVVAMPQVALEVERFLCGCGNERQHLLRCNDDPPEEAAKTPAVQPSSISAPQIKWLCLDCSEPNEPSEELCYFCGYPSPARVEVFVRELKQCAEELEQRAEEKNLADLSEDMLTSGAAQIPLAGEDGFLDEFEKYCVVDARLSALTALIFLTGWRGAAKASLRTTGAQGSSHAEKWVAIYAEHKDKLTADDAAKAETFLGAVDLKEQLTALLETLKKGDALNGEVSIADRVSNIARRLRYYLGQLHKAKASLKKLENSPVPHGAVKRHYGQYAELVKKERGKLERLTRQLPETGDFRMVKHWVFVNLENKADGHLLPENLFSDAPALLAVKQDGDAARECVEAWRDYKVRLSTLAGSTAAADVAIRNVNAVVERLQVQLSATNLAAPCLFTASGGDAVNFFPKPGEGGDGDAVVCHAGVYGYGAAGAKKRGGRIAGLGHYTARIRVDGNWYTCDDASVTPLPLATLQAELHSGICGKWGGHGGDDFLPYVLLYEKRGHVPHEPPMAAAAAAALQQQQGAPAAHARAASAPPQRRHATATQASLAAPPVDTVHVQLPAKDKRLSLEQLQILARVLCPGKRPLPKTRVRGHLRYILPRGYDADQLVGKLGAHTLSLTDAQCLGDNESLNDDVMNLILALEIERSKLLQQPRRTTGSPILYEGGARGPLGRTHVFNTFFLNLLCGTPLIGRYVYERVRRAFKKNLRELDAVIFPYHVPGHWMVIAVDLVMREIHLYDSLRRMIEYTAHRASIIGHIKHWVEDQMGSMGDEPRDTRPWTDFIHDGVPQQADGSVDCGVFSLGFVRCLLDGVGFDFDAADIAYQRRLIALRCFATIG